MGEATPAQDEGVRALVEKFSAWQQVNATMLRNQVDDLLKQFRAHYLNGRKTAVAALKQAAQEQ